MSIRFSGITADAYLGSGGVPTGTAATATFWFYISASTSTFTYLLQLNSAGGNQAYLGSDGTGLALFASDSTGAGFGGFTATPGTWARAGLIINGANWELLIGDGGQALTSYTSTKTPISSLTYLALSGPFSFPMNGRLAAVKLWDAALTTAEVQNELAQFAPVRTTNLLRYHPFHVAETTDYSGNGNTLTAGATPAATEDDPPIPDVVPTAQLRIPVQTIQGP